jgi:voltage-gated potassium channel Kch
VASADSTTDRDLSRSHAPRNCRSPSSRCWAIVTTTTVGYGDVSPVTGEGRLIAVALMLVGISFIGVFTAAVTSYFFDQGRSVDVEALKRKLDQIDAKLDTLLRAGKESH